MSVIRLSARDAGLGTFVRRMKGWSGEFSSTLFLRLAILMCSLLIVVGDISGRCDGAPYCQC
jgi:hypothetical protein